MEKEFYKMLVVFVGAHRCASFEIRAIDILHWAAVRPYRAMSKSQSEHPTASLQPPDQHADYFIRLWSQNQPLIRHLNQRAPLARFYVAEIV